MSSVESRVTYLVAGWKVTCLCWEMMGSESASCHSKVKKKKEKIKKGVVVAQNW